MVVAVDLVLFGGVGVGRPGGPPAACRDKCLLGPSGDGLGFCMHSWYQIHFDVCRQAGRQAGN